FFDLSALALPSHPETFLRVPLTCAMEQEETVGAGAVVMFHVERLDALGSGREDLGVVRLGLRVGVLEVAEDGEVDIPIEVAELWHFDMRHEIARPFDTVENRRDDDHRSGRVRNAIEIEPRQASR